MNLPYFNGHSLGNAIAQGGVHMTGTKNLRTSYPKAFKLEPIHLIKKSSRPLSEIAAELDQQIGSIIYNRL